MLRGDGLIDVGDLIDKKGAKMSFYGITLKELAIAVSQFVSKFESVVMWIYVKDRISLTDNTKSKIALIFGICAFIICLPLNHILNCKIYAQKIGKKSGHQPLACLLHYTKLCTYHVA